MRLRRRVALLMLAGIGAGCAAIQHRDAGWLPEQAPLLYSANRDGNTDIYLRDGSGTVHRLTDHEAGDNWPNASPDGRWVVFQSKRSGNLDIWLMDADGSAPRQLTTDPEPDYLPSFSPDGRTIVFTSWRHADGEARAPRVYRMKVDGSAQERLVARSLDTSSAARFSPDGALLAYSRGIGEGADLFVLDLASGEERRLTKDADAGIYHGAPAFSPDGRSIIAYTDNREHAALVRFDVATGAREVILPEGKNWYPDWSPDGQWLVFTRQRPGGASDEIDIAAIRAQPGAQPIDLQANDGREQEGTWINAGSRR